MKFLIINPGSTSTKIAICEENKILFEDNMIHSVEDLKDFHHVNEQLQYRMNLISQKLQAWEVKVASLDAIVGRGGMLPPLKAGAYEVNEKMVKVLQSQETVEHASNLAAMIAFEMGKEEGIKAYIYDSVSVDELTDVARLSGSPLIPRKSFTHTLNSRAMAHAYAKANQTTYEALNFIIGHLGGGISVNAHQKGKMIDVIPDDEGTFSPERCGRVPCNALIELCYSGKFEKADLKKQMRGKGGMVAYLGTNDAKMVIEKAAEGQEPFKLVVEAMAYQIAKGIGEMATVLEGQVDVIILTGGIAYSDYFTNLIKQKVFFLGKVVVMPGENEIIALSQGVHRALNHEEAIHEF